MEHKLIQGGEIWLPFARSRIKALRATGLEYDSQKFDMGDGSVVKVRYTPGYEYIDIQGGAAYVSAFTGLVYPVTAPNPPVPPSLLPEPSFTKSSVPGVPGGAVINGEVFTTDLPALKNPGTPLFGDPHGASSPYKTDHFYLSKKSIEANPESTLGIQERYPVVSGTRNYWVFFNDELVSEESIRGLYGASSGSTYSGSYVFGEAFFSTATKSATSESSEPIPVVCSGKKPVLATLEGRMINQIYVSSANVARTVSISQIVASGYPDLVFNEVATSYDVFAPQTRRSDIHEGTSFLRVRTAEVNSQGNVSVNTIDFATLSFKDDTFTKTDPLSRTGYIGTSIAGYPLMTASSPSTFWDRTELSSGFSVVNDLNYSNRYRKFFASERISVGQNNAIFAIRETNLFEYKLSRNDNTPPATPSTLTFSFARGYNLSHISSNGSIQDNIVSGDLGAHGFIDAVIPSADNTKVYVYYCLHDASEAIPALNVVNFQTFLATKFNEYLDVIDISEDGAYLTKSSTVSLGSITLRTSVLSDTSGGYPVTDLYSARLHGSSQEVNGYIWADRYCYDVVNNQFYELPGFEPYNYMVGPVERDDKTRNQLTGPRDDHSAYVSVSANGTKASYVIFRGGVVNKYALTKDPATGEKSVVLKTQRTVSGSAAVFLKPPRLKKSKRLATA